MKNPLLAAAWLIAAVAPVLTVVAHAQSAPLAPAGRPDPLHAEAAVPPAEYHSALTDYRPLAEEKVAPWKETNDTVGRIGGWRVYAREAREAGPAAATTAPDTNPVSSEAAEPMPGHQMK